MISVPKMLIHVHAKNISIHLLFHFILIQILPLSFGDAKPLAGKLPAPPVQIERSNSTNAIEPKTNSSSPAASGPAPVSSPPAVNYSLRHIPRKKRHEELHFKLQNLHITHAPCEFDVSRRQIYLPNHCEFVFSTRYISEIRYKIYQLYRLEGFTFHMFYDRLFRYETEQPVWDYSEESA